MKKLFVLAVLAIGMMESCKKENSTETTQQSISIFDGEWLQDSAINNNQSVTYKSDTSFVTYQITGTDFITRKYRHNVLYQTLSTIPNCTIKGDSICFSGKGSYRYTITNGVLKMERTSSGDTFWGHLK